MAQLWGREWAKRDLLERVGDLQQIAGVESFTYSEGVRDGVKATRLRSGGGLDFTVLPSRGMDIAHASFNGKPFGWISATGMTHPHAFEPQETGWLRSFHGGLLTGCGLQNVAAANVDEGKARGIHGYLSHSPAEELKSGTVWNGDEAEIFVEGTVREVVTFGENLRLTRRISTQLGSGTLAITDTVENAGFRTVPLMLLYHLNFGWPLVSEDTEIVVDSLTPPEPRDAVAAKGLANAQRLDAPTPDYSEQCFFYDPATDADGWANVQMINRASKFGVTIRYDKSELPFLTQWKQMGQAEYVCGIEPGNCKVMGRAAERAAGRLQSIEPGEIRTFHVTITASQG